MAVGAPPMGGAPTGGPTKAVGPSWVQPLPPSPLSPPPHPPKRAPTQKKGLLLLPLPVRPEQFHKERHAVARSPLGGGGTVHVEPAPPTLDPARRQVGANEGARAAHLQSPTQEAHI